MGLTELFVSPLIDGGSGALVRDASSSPLTRSLLLISGSPDDERMASTTLLPTLSASSRTRLDAPASRASSSPPEAAPTMAS